MSTDDPDLRRALLLLTARGWTCLPPQDAELCSQVELQQRFRLSPGALWKRLHHPACPRSTRVRGVKGTIRWVRLTPALAAWLARPLQPGRTLAATLVQPACTPTAGGE